MLDAAMLQPTTLAQCGNVYAPSVYDSYTTESYDMMLDTTITWQSSHTHRLLQRQVGHACSSGGVAWTKLKDGPLLSTS